LQGRIRSAELRLETSACVGKNDEVAIACGDDVLCRIASPPPLRMDLVPVGYVELFRDNDGSLKQEFLECVLFIMKKDVMKQDIFLIGSPGRTRRDVILAYCELTLREVEIVCISQDTTVSDIKQRREIRKLDAVFVDGPAVRAAILGRILILDGVEKAERNILSVLNNLLENREMHLEDGRFLTNPSRFEIQDENHRQELLNHHNKLVPVHPRFRTVALGLPIPGKLFLDYLELVH